MESKTRARESVWKLALSIPDLAIHRKARLARQAFLRRAARERGRPPARARDAAEDAGENLGACDAAARCSEAQLDGSIDAAQAASVGGGR